MKTIKGSKDFRTPMHGILVNKDQFSKTIKKQISRQDVKAWRGDFDQRYGAPTNFNNVNEKGS